MAFAGSMTGVAWAPKNLAVHVIEAPCAVPAGAGDFLGSITLTGFTTVDGRLYGVGTVSGSCATRSTKVVAEGGIVVPVSIQELSCHQLDLVLGDVSMPATGLTVGTSGMHLYLAPGTRASQARFCTAERLAATRSLEEMLAPLSQLLFQ
jgi:hypothetical protein